MWLLSLCKLSSYRVPKRWNTCQVHLCQVHIWVSGVFVPGALVPGVFVPGVHIWVSGVSVPGAHMWMWGAGTRCHQSGQLSYLTRLLSDQKVSARSCTHLTLKSWDQELANDENVSEKWKNIQNIAQTTTELGWGVAEMMYRCCFCEMFLWISVLAPSAAPYHRRPIFHIFHFRLAILLSFRWWLPQHQDLNSSARADSEG